MDVRNASHQQSTHDRLWLQWNSYSIQHIEHTATELHTKSDMYKAYTKPSVTKTQANSKQAIPCSCSVSLLAIRSEAGFFLFFFPCCRFLTLLSHLYLYVFNMHLYGTSDRVCARIQNKMYHSNLPEWDRERDGGGDREVLLMLMLMFTILRSTLSYLLSCATCTHTKNRREKQKHTRNKKLLSLRSRTLNNNECATLTRARTHTIYDSVVNAIYFNFACYFSCSLAALNNNAYVVFLFLYASFVLINVYPIHIRKKHTHTTVRDQKLLCFDCFDFVLFNSFILWFLCVCATPKSSSCLSIFFCPFSFVECLLSI